jgi:sulfur-oxidizing protein SoxZ
MILGRVQVPASAKRGEVVEVRIAIQHPMETGFRFDLMGQAIPKNVINSLRVRYNGTEVFRAALGTGVAANPYLQFYVIAEASGEFDFEWVDDLGERGAEKAEIAVIGD